MLILVYSCYQKPCPFLVRSKNIVYNVNNIVELTAAVNLNIYIYTINYPSKCCTIYNNFPWLTML